MKIKLLIAALLAATCPAAVLATEVPQKPATDPYAAWSAWGGSISVGLNRGQMHDIGMELQSQAEKLPANTKRLTDGLNVYQAQGFDMFALRQSGSIEFRAQSGDFAGFLSGSLQARGGYVFKLASGEVVDMTDFRLRPTPGKPMYLDVIDAKGTVWFYVDKLMFELVRDNSVLAIYTADMRISSELAARSGHPEMVGHPIGDLEILSEVMRQGGGGVRQIEATTHWHGEQVDDQPAGTVYQADLFMQTINFAKLRQRNTTGEAGNGEVVFAPDSTLRNNVNIGSPVPTISGQGALGTSAALWTARIPWYTKFSGNFAPYNNDQHPFLIWNMYRINPDGGIEQIARSQVKHAFVIANVGCLEASNSHILGRGCQDTYSTGNNDGLSNLSLRSEIIPATNQWGRCGSLFDPNCTGSSTVSTPGSGTAGSDFLRRLVVNESQISATQNPGAKFLFDSWYLARQDINIYNSMASVTGTPTYSGSNWIWAGQGNYKLGSVVDRWLSENAAANVVASNNELSVGEGHAKVAVRVINLGNGQWRYHFAVHNLDFARAVTQGAEPNFFRVISNKGFSAFSVPLPAGVNVISSNFSDGDLNAGNQWTFGSSGGALTWTAPTGGSLDWGTLYLFSVVLDSAPVAGTTTLNVAEAGMPATFDVSALVPSSGDVIYQGGFDSVAP